MEPSRLPKQYSTIVIDKKIPSVLGSDIDAPTPSSSVNPDIIQAFPHSPDGSPPPTGSIIALPPPPQPPPPPPQPPTLAQPQQPPQQLPQPPPQPPAQQPPPQIREPPLAVHDGPSSSSPSLSPSPASLASSSQLGPAAQSRARSRSKSRSKSRSSSRGRKLGLNQQQPQQQQQQQQQQHKPRALNLPRAASVALSRTSRDQRAQVRARARRDLNLEIDTERERYPFCLVWTPLPLVTWLLPLIGHSGISNSRGLISDFSGDFRVDMDNFAFGSPTKYYQFDPDEIDLSAAFLSGKSRSGSKRRAATSGFHDPNRVGVHLDPSEWEAAKRDHDKRALVWDGAIREASEYYRQHKYNMYFRNCYAYIACVLNKCNYAGASDWSPSDVWWMISFMSSYAHAYGCLRQWSIFVALVVGLIVLVALLAR